MSRPSPLPAPVMAVARGIVLFVMDGLPFGATIGDLATLLFWMLDIRDGTARAEAVDFGSTEPELFENLFVVFSDFRGALGRHFGHAMHLNGAADRRC